MRIQKYGYNGHIPLKHTGGDEGMLPKEFLTRMEQLLGKEYPDFLQSYDRPRAQALRFNPLKGKLADFLERAPFTLRPVPWETNGFYYGQGETPGKHPYHEAGVYYIQEPSAMAPAAYLDPQPGERVFDLCAAPGGKSTQIAAAMQGRGILISNEIHPARAKILSENMERMGVTNAVVTNESPDTLAERFESWFDRIMVDAPCSGEGMFRKNEDAAEEWSPENVQLCASRQDKILECAAGMLKPGGRMVYSTCTFAPEENEGTISRFLEKHEEFILCETPKYPGMEPAGGKWMKEAPVSLENGIRLFPHRLEGEGHFLAVLQKKGASPEGYRGSCGGCEKEAAKKELGEYFAFCRENLKQIPVGKLLRFGEQLYLAPEDLPALKGLKVLRPGLHLGTLKKNRFEPSHALALSLSREEVCHTWELSAAAEEIRAYLSGQTFPAEGEKGWYLITVDGYSIGWGKLAGNTMKNHYPKGLRISYRS